MKFLIENDIISLSDVQEQIAEMNLEKYVRKTHSHEIWKGKDGRWRTYVPDEKTPKKRRMVAKSSKRKLLEYLLDIQESRESEMFPETSGETSVFSDIVTIRQLFSQWLEHKKLMVAETTVPRIESDWMKYYDRDPIVDLPIGSLNKIQLESWVMHLIRDHEMTKKNFYNVSLIMRQIFQYAYDAEIAALEKLIWADFAVKGRKVYRLAPLAVLFQLYTATWMSPRPSGTIRLTERMRQSGMNRSKGRCLLGLTAQFMKKCNHFLTQSVIISHRIQRDPKKQEIKSIFENLDFAIKKRPDTNVRSSKNTVHPQGLEQD